MTVTATINSGALNEVGFPGSQQGESLIELVGTVVVAATISTVAVLSTTGAKAAPAAYGVAGQPKIRATLSASAEPSVSSTCGVRTKIELVTDDLVIGATAGSPQANLYRRVAASSIAEVAPAAFANIKTHRGASSVCYAQDYAASTIRQIRLFGQTQGSASPSANALRKTPVFAAQSASALSSVTSVRGRAVSAFAPASALGSTSEYIFHRHVASAIVAPSAAGAATTRRHATASARIPAEAISSVLALREQRFAAATFAAAASLAPNALLEVLRGAVQPVVAATSAKPKGVYRVGAVTVGSSAAVVLNCEVVNFVYAQPISGAALAKNIDALSRIHFPAIGLAQAKTVSGVAMRLRPQASASATANAIAAGSDFAIAAPAPTERRMSVSAQNRRMEVLT